MRSRAAAALLALLLLPAPLAAQGWLLRLESRAQSVDYRGIRLDSIPATAVDTAPDGSLVTPDGFAVDCAAGATQCEFYRPGRTRSGGPLVTTADLTAWGLGVPRLSLHANARLGVDLGASDVWPGTDPALQLLEGYLEYGGEWLTGRLGRQVERGRLGYTGFDGGLVGVRESRYGLGAEVYGGFGLARGTALPVTSAALNPLDDFQPRQRQLVVGLNGEWRPGPGELRVEYQREVDRDTRNFVSERAAVSGTLRPFPGLRFDGGFEYDFARGLWGTAELDARFGQPRWSASVGVRRYRPYFDLWTIWGVFSPVPYTATRGSLWLTPLAGLDLHASGERYWYSDTETDTPLLDQQDEGWRWSLGAGLAFAERWHAGAGLHREFGPGAASEGWDASLSWNPVERISLSADGGRIIRPLEFRYNEVAVTWVGLHADLKPADRWRIGLSATRYYEDRRRPDASAFDWDQTRLVASISWLLGSGADRLPLPPAVRRRADR